MSTLQQQIDTARMQVNTDSYPMSIGELINLYDDGELDIHPEFQRVYRWSTEQKSRLIESILLGIPLPSIFVAQRKDGVWDVVDGLQRISTILSFLGKLKDEKGEVQKPLILQATKYLPSLQDRVWEDRHNPEKEIDVEIKRIFKREKIDVKIIKRESDNDTKFELFQRLNTGGSKLSDQEVRNCMLLMHNRDAFFWLKELTKNSSFKATLPISDKQSEESYDAELALRFFIYRNSNEAIRKEHTDVAPYLNAEMIRIFDEKNNFNFENEKSIFINTFKIAEEALDDSAFKKYNHEKQKYEGAISLPVYEAASFGLSKLIESGKYDSAQLVNLFIEKTKLLTQDAEYKRVMENRTRPIDRMVEMSKIASRVFK
ncbi:conserved hypothetical protein [Acinetobacter proteolyticus]|uniref:GmrSD restriction endonucleases N-terminal domain-containing protein n=1 Tax=Acinetobacter proteolyticus TaxID=1776741 RepID=A0A653K8X1_9GAMM|nr:DUF262 domain-containing protein [Acinetobacter proteolyticus]VXA57315.1 conserved hypothetical protein [Acinetobacter proteolyticus]